MQVCASIVLAVDVRHSCESRALSIVLGGLQDARFLSRTRDFWADSLRLGAYYVTPRRDIAE